jgi:hypothetical protein
MNNKSNVHAILLDATKAFDRVQYIKLFQELLERNLCPVLCRFLALQYSMQQCRVKWCNSISDSFLASNGVKQGGVLSPILFTIYMDCLLQKLRMSGTGCYIGHVFAGAFAYADDLVLLAPTRGSMEILINICEEFSQEFSISFNATKSKHIYFSKTHGYSAIPFQMQGNNIPTVEFDKHLGNLIGQDIFHQVIDESTHELYRNVNILLSQFSKVDIDTRYKLFKTFCMSIYGSQLWDFEDKYCEKFYTAWRKSIRKLYKLPRQAHSCLLHLICQDIPINVQMYIRFLKKFKSCKQSASICVRMCCKLAVNGSRSSMSNSLSHVCKRLQLNRNNCEFVIHHIKQNAIAKDAIVNRRKAGLIRDLLSYGHDVYMMKMSVVSGLIEDICTN